MNKNQVSTISKDANGTIIMFANLVHPPSGKLHSEYQVNLYEIPMEQNSLKFQMVLV